MTTVTDRENKKKTKIQEYLPGLSPVAVEVSKIEALWLTIVLTIKVIESHIVGLVLNGILAIGIILFKTCSAHTL